MENNPQTQKLCSRMSKYFHVFLTMQTIQMIKTESIPPLASYHHKLQPPSTLHKTIKLFFYIRKPEKSRNSMILIEKYLPGLEEAIICETDPQFRREEETQTLFII